MSNINCVLRTVLLLLVVGFLLTCALVCRAATLAVPDAEALLKRSDAYRNGWPSYVLRVKITHYESGKADEDKLYEVSQKGTERTYVEFLSPREKGEHLLMLGDDMWVYLPDTSRPVRITPLERLNGDASNGDVARTNFSVDYSAVYLRTEKIGAENCYVLDLTAKRKGSTYQRILYWLRVEDARPVRAEFYLPRANTSSQQPLTSMLPSTAEAGCFAGLFTTRSAITRTACWNTPTSLHASYQTNFSTRDGRTASDHHEIALGNSGDAHALCRADRCPGAG